MTLCVEKGANRSTGAVLKRDFWQLGLGLAVGFGGRAQSWAAASTGPIRVAAASDLQFALAELAEQYQRETGQPVQLSLGSSGSFAQQIRQGLPLDLFLSADEEYVLQLAAAGLTQDRGVIYALGRISLIVPAHSKIQLDPGLAGLREALPGIRHFAIGNPEHAPYGRAGRQALQQLGLWQLLQPKLVIGENIAQATQFVTSGAADAGITAASLARAPELARQTRSLTLPARLHSPLRQRMVLLRSANPAAAGLYRFLQTPRARAVLQRFGFDIE